MELGGRNKEGGGVVVVQGLLVTAQQQGVGEQAQGHARVEEFWGSRDWEVVMGT